MIVLNNSGKTTTWNLYQSYKTHKFYVCGLCGNTTLAAPRYDYCPFCGARTIMERDKK